MDDRQCLAKEWTLERLDFETLFTCFHLLLLKPRQWRRDEIHDSTTSIMSCGHAQYRISLNIQLQAPAKDSTLR